MPVTMKDVRAVLDPEEPNYQKAAQLGPDSIPHLEVLAGGDDTLLASKAIYLASLIKDAKSSAIVGKGAQSDDPAVRVAAAAAASNLPAGAASAVLLELVTDPDVGVRKAARTAVPDKPNAKLAGKLKTLKEEPGPRDEATASPDYGPVVFGLMPGEIAEDAASGSQETMPGERVDVMPGEHAKMPGE